MMQIRKLSIITFFLILSFLFASCSRTEMSVSPALSLKDSRLGSTAYVGGIMSISRQSGSRNALSVVMKDVDSRNDELDHNSPDNIIRFYRLVSYLVSKIGYVDQQTHYFRNKLNRAPASLKELMDQNRKSPVNRRWVLLSVLNSAYHIQGTEGEYNLKFISAEGFCEAVYNKEGILLTDRNDPVNMGTFNFAAGIREITAHEKYDVVPYLKWGNTPDSPQKGSAAINRGLYAALSQYQANAAKVYIYRKDLFGMQQGRVP